MTDNETEDRHGRINAVRELVAQFLRDEIETDEGKINYWTMLVLAALVMIIGGTTPLVEGIVKTIRPDADFGLPLLGIVIVMAVFGIICVTIVGLLNRSRRR